MNIQDVRERITEFLAIRVRIDYWGLDYPDELYTQIGFTTLPANSAISLPVQDVVHTRENFNQVRTKLRFPYRIAYRFPGQLPYHDIPFRSLEGMLEYIHIYVLTQVPDPNILSFTPAILEDSITVARVEEIQTDPDWIVYLNFAIDTEFITTVLPDITDLQPPDFFDEDNLPSIDEINIRINRAKQGFQREDNSTYIIDSEINITL